MFIVDLHVENHNLSAFLVVRPILEWIVLFVQNLSAKSNLKTFIKELSLNFWSSYFKFIP